MNEGEGVQKVRMGAWTAPGCHGGCIIDLYIKHGKVIKVEGVPEDIHTHGRLCNRVLALTQYMYHPDRLKHPLKRIGERGEGKWQQISWGEAFDICEERLREIKEKYGPESIIFGQGTGRDSGGPMTFLAYAYGSPNWTIFGLTGTSCFTPRLAGQFMVFGDHSTWPDAGQFSPLGYEDPEWVPPKCTIVWGGHSHVGCWGHFWADFFIVDLMKQGSKLIVVDPKCTWEASRAALWLQIRPGTDGALALGMLNVIINEGLYDKEFVDKWTFGFDELKERVQEYPPERVAEITWIPKEKIVQAARMYAESKPAGIVVGGPPVDWVADGVSAQQAIASLWIITGNLDVPGGQVIMRSQFGTTTYPYSTEEVIELYGEELVEKLNKKRIGADRYPLIRNFRAWAEPDLVLEAMETGEPYPIKGTWIQTSNWMANTAMDVRRHYEAVRKLDFNVVVDLFMTPTAQATADIVLPAATFPEKDSVFTTGVPLTVMHKVVQVGECKSDWEINFELAKRLNPEAVPWKDVKEMLTYRLKPTGLTFEELSQQAYAIAPKGHPSGCIPYRRHEKGLLRPDGKPGFRTPTGKAELYVTRYENWGLDPLPYYEEPPESPVRTPEVWKEYPLILLAGRRGPAHFHSEHRQIPWLREIEPDPWVEIHPDTAKALGIEDGNWVWIEGRMGRVKRKAVLTKTMHPKVVQAAHGWWYPEREGKAPYFYGVWELNLNQLIPAGCHGKQHGYGGAPLRTMLCKVYKV